jgi:hypothetical protein
MDAFEVLIAQILRREGYWTITSFKVDLTKEEKRDIGRHSAPRWEIDVVAYKGSTNEVLAVECKSFLDSTGVVFRKGCFEFEERYKLFSDTRCRDVVLAALGKQLVESGACKRSPKVRLALATGKLARKSDRAGMEAHFESNGWLLFDDHWIRDRLQRSAQFGYENEVATIVAKLLLREQKTKS